MFYRSQKSYNGWGITETLGKEIDGFQAVHFSYKLPKV